jgi:hypothetical protein
MFIIFPLCFTMYIERGTCKYAHFRILLSIIVPYQRRWSNFPHCRLYRSFVSLEEWKIDLGHQNVRTLMTWELLGINQTVYRIELPWRSSAYATTLLYYQDAKYLTSQDITEFNVNKDRWLKMFMPCLLFIVAIQTTNYVSFRFHLYTSSVWAGSFLFDSNVSWRNPTAITNQVNFKSL